MPDPASWALGAKALPLLVGVGSGVATFVASVMGDEQNERLKNGTFGAVAGTSIGGLAGLMKNQPDLVVVGFFGSVVGALIGWLTYLWLSYMATRDPNWRTMLDFQTGGLKAVQSRIALDDQQKILKALNVWRDDFSRMILADKAKLVTLSGDAFCHSARITINTWIVSVVDFFGFFFDTLANKPNYRSRVTVILFGRKDGAITGSHWIAYAGDLTPHRKDQLFDQGSIGYQVLSGQKPSTYFTTSQSAKTEGQKRADDPSYRPFITFRINDSAVLAIDWPNDLPSDGSDPYVAFARSLFQSLITAAIGELLDHWPTSVQTNVHLQPLAAIPAPVPQNNQPH
jgi:hypothetical protein